MHGFPRHGHGHGFDEFRQGVHGAHEDHGDIEGQEDQGNQTNPNFLYFKGRMRDF